MKTSTFTRSVIGAVDGFLNVAARFLQNLSHLAGHVGGVLIFVLNKDLSEAEEQLGTLRSRSGAPFIKRSLRRINGCVDVFAGREGKAAYNITVICRV